MEYVFIAVAAAVVVAVSLLVYRAVSEAAHEREYQRFIDSIRKASRPTGNVWTWSETVSRCPECQQCSCKKEEK